jgi:uncharacterized protein (TIGR02217 family)
MTLPTFPTFPGQGWSVHKKPTFSTRVSSHSSGREVRVGLYAHALYEFELTFDGLDSSGAFPGLQSQSLQALMGFFLSLGGQLNAFLYADPTDNVVNGQAIATGDGATTSFTLVRSIGGYAEPVSYAVAVSGVSVAGVSTSAWTLSAPNIITFTTAPANGAAIVANVSYAFQCRFLDDQMDFDNFMSGLWSNKSVKFRQVR